MKRGFLYAIVSLLSFGLLSAILIPLIFPKGNIDKLAETTGELSVWLIALPAFIIGYLRDKKEKREEDQFEKSKTNRIFP